MALMKRYGAPTGKRSRRQMARDQERYERELVEAREKGDASAVATGLNNLGTVATDRGDHAAARDYYRQALEALDESASAEELFTAHGNLAAAARACEDYPAALHHAMTAEAIALREELRDEAEYSALAIALVRRAVGLEEFRALFERTRRQLPEDLRDYTRADKHLNPTFEHEGPTVGRNDPCPCGSGKKYKRCCGR